jgi:signal transduction histidine kinase
LGPLDLSAQQNSLTVEFGAIDFASPAHAAYQYRLEGATGGWSAATTNSSVTFANLSPGKYRFVVRSASPAAPGAPEAAFQFTILPPLWRRWWFEVVLLLAAAAVAYALHRTQLQRKLALERVRSSVAMDLHDDLGASLSRMSVIAEVLKSNVRQNDLDSQLMLNDVAETSRRLVEGMNDIVWSIDPRHDQAGDIVNRIRDFASGLLEPKGIDLRLDVSARVLNARLSASQRRQLYLVCKEAIHNIARHSKARHALVRLAVDSGTLCADIEDDGCGMPSDNGHGLGLSSMRARAAELGGSLEVGPAAEQGTRVTLRFPLRS